MEIVLGIAALAGLGLAALARAGEVRARREAGEAREERARAEADAAQLRERLADKHGEVERAGAGKESFASIEKLIAEMRQTVDTVRKDQASRAQSMTETLAAVRDQQRRALEGVERLTGRFANPKRRGSLAEDWLVVALEGFELRRDIHFTVQQATALGEDAPGTRAQLDVYLKLPGEDGIALDAKFPWSEAHARVDAAEEEERDQILAHLAERIRSHVKELGSRGYRAATDVNVRSVWLIVPDWYSLELARQADPALADFAREHGVSIVPVDGLFEVANALMLAHQFQDWSEKVAGAFSPEQAEAKLAALAKLVGKLGDVAKKFNALGKTIDSVFASFDARGDVMRHVIKPTEELASKELGSLEANLAELDEARADALVERLESGASRIEITRATDGDAERPELAA